jgi:hypothetical protein
MYAFIFLKGGIGGDGKPAINGGDITSSGSGPYHDYNGCNDGSAHAHSGNTND